MSTKKISFVEIMLWLFVVLLILLTVAPFALGFKVKSDYTNLVNQFAQDLQLDLKIAQYEQGVFSSDVIVVLQLPEVPEKIRFKEEIIHGPVYFGLLAQGKSPLAAAVVKGQLDISTTQKEMVRQIFAGKNPLVYQEVISFTGDVEAQAYVPAINTTFEDEMGPVTIQSSGLIINQSFSAENGELKGDADIPVFKVQSELFSVNTESVTFSFSGAMGNNQIIIGDSVASFNLFDIDSGDEQFAIRDFTVRSVTSENDTLINSGAQISAREILASNQKFGPIQLNLSLNGLNAQSLTKIQKLQKAAEHQLGEGIPPEQVNAMMTGEIMGLVPALIKEAEININPLSISSELGKLEADMDFMLEGIGEDTPADPMFLLSAIKMDLNMSIDEPLLRQLITWQLMGDEQSAGGTQKEMNVSLLNRKIDQNIKSIVDESWLVMNEGVYMSNISMQQGELMINGKSVDPMQQIMSTMGAGGAPQ